ncbi:MAG: DNA polymerase [Candidatus Nomurabacteria bacterium]|nr:DNA polymerase [Candidatus Nomurabacteria bacterium]
MAKTTEKPKRLILLDTHAIIHRAYHALPDFRSSGGEPTGALYGIVAMLMKIIQDLKPDYVVATYDLPGKTFRHEAYDDYKAGRGESDDDLVDQIKSSYDIMTAFNIPVYSEPGFEADDMLGTIVEQILQKQHLSPTLSSADDTDPLANVEVIIASGDMDTLQLVVGDIVKVYTLKRGLNDTILYNEDAVRDRFSFGPQQMIDYKGLRGDPSDNIPGIRGIGEKTATELITKFGSIEGIYKTLRGKDGEQKMLDAGIKKRIVGLLDEGEEEAEFSKTLATIRRDASIDFVLPEKEFIENLDFDAIEKLLVKLEFRTLWTRIKKQFGLDADPEEEPETQEIIDELELEQTGIAVWLLNSELTNPTLDDILQYAETKSFREARKKILNELVEKNLTDVYKEIELPIVPMVHAMEERGILLDLPYLKKLSADYHTELSKFESAIYKMAGREFNIKSPKQLGEVLFDEMELTAKGLKKTAGGKRSTKESELEKMRESHPIIDQILKFRELQKLLSTYIDNLPGMVGDDGRLHAKFLQTGTTTGRFSSQNPNLQNIPIKSDLGRAIRGGFISSPGYTMAAFDYSQIELRCAAILSGDPTLTQIFADGQDVHTAVAARVFDVPEADVTRQQRSKAKVINFGIIYGMGVSALQKNLGSTRAEAQDFFNQYFERFPRIREYLDEVKASAYETGYTETLFGRRRYFPGLASHIQFIKAMAERTAINAPVQGTATADVIKLAIKHVHDKLESEGLLDQVHLILQIHDELVYEIADDVVDQVVTMIDDAMEHVLQNSFINYKTDVPLVVNYGTGKRWSEMKD